MDVLQQLSSGDPVGIQNTYITVLSNNRSVRPGGLGELRLQIQGIPHQNLVRRTGTCAAEVPLQCHNDSQFITCVAGG
jgi:hypothetical protein